MDYIWFCEDGSWGDDKLRFIRAEYVDLVHLNDGGCIREIIDGKPCLLFKNGKLIPETYSGNSY